STIAMPYAPAGSMTGPKTITLPSFIRPVRYAACCCMTARSESVISCAKVGRQGTSLRKKWLGMVCSLDQAGRSGESNESLHSSYLQDVAQLSFAGRV